MTTRRGYLVAVGLLVAGWGLAGFFFWRLWDQIDSMPRIEMPGEQTVTLPAGELVVYAEEPPGHAGTFSVSARCVATDAGGRELPLSKPGSRTTYTMGGHSGGNLFELEVPAAGPVTMRCDSDDRFVLAIGDGIGTSIALAAVTALAGTFLGLGVAFRTWWRRRRERRATAAIPIATVV